MKKMLRKKVARRDGETGEQEAFFASSHLAGREAKVQPTLGALGDPAAQVVQWNSRNR